MYPNLNIIESIVKASEHATPGPWFDITFDKTVTGDDPEQVIISCDWPSVIPVALMERSLTAELVEQQSNASLICLLRNNIQLFLDAAKAKLHIYRVEHKKRGSKYGVLGRATLQCDAKTQLVDYDKLIIYQDEKTGELWARPEDEFHDGRYRAEIIGDENYG